MNPTPRADITLLHLGKPLPVGSVYTDPPERLEHTPVFAKGIWLYVVGNTKLRPRSAVALLYRKRLVEHLESHSYEVLDTRCTLIKTLDPEGLTRLVWGERDLKAYTIQKRLPALNGPVRIAHPRPASLRSLLEHTPWISTLEFKVDLTAPDKNRVSYVEI